MHGTWKYSDITNGTSTWSIVMPDELMEHNSIPSALHVPITQTLKRVVSSGPCSLTTKLLSNILLSLDIVTMGLNVLSSYTQQCCLVPYVQTNSAIVSIFISKGRKIISYSSDVNVVA